MRTWGVSFMVQDSSRSNATGFSLFSNKLRILDIQKSKSATNKERNPDALLGAFVK